MIDAFNLCEQSETVSKSVEKPTLQGGSSCITDKKPTRSKTTKRSKGSKGSNGSKRSKGSKGSKRLAKPKRQSKKQ